jgi:2-oxoglutarate ferredoxin oxidoreductase subunit alpha
MGHVYREVQKALGYADHVFLANRIDGVFITPTDIRQTLRLITGKGV